MSGVVYQDSQLVLSVIPTENCTFVSASIEGKLNGSTTYTYPFDKTDDIDNACSTSMLSVYVGYSGTGKTDFLNKYIFAHTVSS